MSTNPVAFYTKEKAHFESLLTKTKKELGLLSTIRFIAFVTTVFSVYYFLGDPTKMLISVVIGGGIFSVFLKKYWRKKERKDELSSLVSINKLELDVLSGDTSNLKTGEEYKDPSHQFSFDIDLFGVGSFFQILNRTVTSAGTIKLVSLLSGNQIAAIEEKQECIKELAAIPKWRQKFSSLASAVHAEVSPAEIVAWIKKHKLAIPSFMKFVPLVFSIVSLALILSISFLGISFSFLTIWFFIGLGFSGLYLKQVNNLYTKAGKIKTTFQQYYKLLEVLESTEFSSKLLKEHHNKVFSKSAKSSVLMKEFFEYLNSLDQRNNVIFAIFGNGLLLWDVKHAYKIEQWIEKNKEHVEDWFGVISFFDAQNSLANFVFNYPDYSYPLIVDKGPVLQATQLGHPLLSESSRVTSDCTIDANAFFIVTGANMAGKSTFLRTISLSIVMSNIGLPVCAGNMLYKPIKLITSIRNSDSLSDDTSYFFSELKRLKYIVDALKTDDYFIILDEILKGTNSTDKAEGSQQFVEKLVKSNATGIIATHDLSLCEIEKDYQQIHNFYFDAEIKNDELFFDYKLKKGVCQNMNASFLLRKMEIV